MKVINAQVRCLSCKKAGHILFEWRSTQQMISTKNGRGLWFPFLKFCWGNNSTKLIALGFHEIFYHRFDWWSPPPAVGVYTIQHNRKSVIWSQFTILTKTISLTHTYIYVYTHACKQSLVNKQSHTIMQTYITLFSFFFINHSIKLTNIQA